MSKPLLFLLFVSWVGMANAQLIYNLEDIILRAKEQSPSAKQAETRKENRYWQYRLFKAQYNPQLSISGDIPGYNKDYLPNRLDDGSIHFIPRQQYSSSMNLGLNQPIAFSGGNISVNSRVRQFDDLGLNLKQWNTTVFNIQLDQPIFAYNSLKWDKMTEPLRYEESKRSYVEEMELVSRIAVERFFDYLDAQVNYQIANFNLANNDTIYHIEEGRYNIGTTSEDKLLQVELQLLRSRQDVAQAQLALQTSRLALRTFIGLNDATEFDLILPEVIPVFLVSEEIALQYAEANRADFIAFERRRIEAQSQVEEAKRQRFQTSVSAAIGYNNAAPLLAETYQNPRDQQVFNISLNVPLITWGRNEARIRTAMANQQLTNYIIDQEEQNFEMEIITQVRQLDVLREQIEISKKSDEVAQNRYNVAQNRYLIGKIDITNLNIALNEKDLAKRSYVQALRSFWSAYFDLRRLTLYDFANRELLYQINE
ncbi:MAG: TolC family protein [Cyclobacteriaceae bacterium]|nr:TolC family protein [Cyclobacteriaceae bacterium]